MKSNDVREKEVIEMANVVTKTAKKTVKKAGKKAVKSGVNYAKGYFAKLALVWAIGAALVYVKTTFGFELPEWASGADTIGIVAFIAVGTLVYGRKLSVGRVIALVRTFVK